MNNRWFRDGVDFHGLYFRFRITSVPLVIDFWMKIMLFKLSLWFCSNFGFDKVLQQNLAFFTFFCTILFEMVIDGCWLMEHLIFECF
ncbi:hypothetical protein Scep_001886 [Stephania cephalantha]|uniref:Uncharacterized protein n=1 Tax=Stephania cephalantha TaxID=152367 RepID=A0AAP0LBM9_9MAGN